MADKKKIIKVEDIKKEAEKQGCPVEQIIFYVSGFLSGPMCGKCFPCSMGSYEAKIILERIKNGYGSENDISKLKRIADDMLIASMCKRGKDTAKFMLEWIKADALKRHIHGVCPDKQCKAFIKYLIIPEKCTLCGLCKKACKYNAIHGETPAPFQTGYPPFEIRQAMCVKCGDCVSVCPEGAIIIVDIKEAELSAVEK